ncbi:uncharacterized protein FYW47_001766 [Aplochiton taeniatus]
MQQELWLRAKSQVLSSLKPVCALRSTSAIGPPLQLIRAADRTPNATMSSSNPAPHLQLIRAADRTPNATMSSSNPAPTYPLPPPRTPSLGLRSRTTSNTPTHPQSRDNGLKAELKCSSPVEGAAGLTNPIKTSRTHQELHKELLLAHKKGLGLCSKPELQQVLERRKREQTEKEEEEQGRSPLEEVLLKRQQKHIERQKQQEEKMQEEAQLLEFVRVRQNLKKIHCAFQKASSP